MKLLVLTTTALLISGSAFAADAVYGDVPAAPVAEVAAESFDWTGLYLGAFGGVSTGDFKYEAGPTGGDPLGGIDISGGGFIGGAQVGYDWQIGNWVIGGVADAFAALLNFIEESRRCAARRYRCRHVGLRGFFCRCCGSLIV